MIVGLLLAGETPEVMCDEYRLRRADLVVACWYEARHGDHLRRQKLAGWAYRHRVDETLHSGNYEVPLPTEEGGDGR